MLSLHTSELVVMVLLGCTNNSLGERMNMLTKEAEWEKALKDVANATAQDKGKAAKVTEKKAQSLEKAWLLVEKGSMEMEAKLGETELNLVQAESLNLAHAKEVADLKMAFKACESKWYDEGFVDAEGFADVYQAWVHGFKEGWMAALQALGVP